MKIIDLLNKIAKGEEVPKKIKFNEGIYTYHDKEHGYCKHHYDNTYICINSEYYLFDILNDKVEIIEEDNKIEKLDIKQEKKCKGNWKWKCNEYNISTPQKILGDKINELIDEINYIRSNK